MSLFHPLQNLSPKCEQIRSPVTQDGCKTTVQLSYKLITGENYDDWVKSFPKNVKVDNTLVVFNTPIVTGECQGGPYTYQPFTQKSRTPNFSRLNCFQLLTEEDCHYERNEILSGTMWSKILSTSVNITPTKLMQLYWSALDTGQSALQLIRFFPLIMFTILFIPSVLYE